MTITTTTKTAGQGSGESAMRLLLVEDDAVDRAAVRRALRRQGGSIEIVEASDIAAGLAALREHTLHCALVDFRLPDGTALDLMDKLDPAVRSSLPIVILTGLDDDSVALEALQRGAQDYIRKDAMDGQVLLRAIRFAIERTQVLELQQRLLHADRLISIGQLAAGVAHEVNNPAGYVLGNLELLSDYLGSIERAFDEARARVAETGSEAALSVINEVVKEHDLPDTFAECRAMIQAGLFGMEQIRSIIKGLRSFARIEQGEVERIDLTQVIDASCRMVHNQLRHRAKLERDVTALPLVAIDRGKLTQVFTNLLVNAAQAIEPGAADCNTIRVAGRTDGSRIQVSIEDTGAGISPEALVRVFEPFFTTKPRDQGTGLGLPLCLDIVRQHGGDIRIDSTVGEGTRVEVILPIETGLEVSGESPALERAETIPPALLGQKRARVLVVDDEAELGRTYQRMLAPYHDVLVADGGKQGLEVLGQDHRFDVILCDLMMPEVDGVALYQYLSDKRPELVGRIVFCTGGVFTTRVSAFLASMQVACLNKPLSRNELLDVVARTAEGG